jgi:hypothetical protein
MADGLHDSRISSPWIPVHIMSDLVHATAPLRRWVGGNGGNWFLLTITGEPARAIAAHALVRRLEEGRRRGFGSVKVTALVGESRWRTSVFPTREGDWVMLVKAAVRRAEDISEADMVELALELD